MEHIKTTKRISLICGMLLWLTSCKAQLTKEVDQSYLYGKWRCVKHDFRGFQKMGFDPNQIMNSTLTIVDISFKVLY